MKLENEENVTKNKVIKQRIIKLSLSMISLMIIIIGSYFGYTTYYLPSKTGYNIEVYGDNEMLYDKITFKKGSYIQLLNKDNQLVEKIYLEDTNKLTLKNANDTEDLLFKKWQIEMQVAEKERFYQKDIIYFNAKPIYEQKENYILTFKTDEQATLFIDEQEISYFRTAYKRGDNLTRYLPKININEHFKGHWYIGDLKIDNDTTIEKDSELIFKTFQDKNNNNIDDFTEKFTINFITNTDDKISNKVVKWEETIKLPVLTHESKIFYDWYQDIEFKKRFTDHTKVTENLTLYAKLEAFDDVINKTIDNPIDRKDVALQVEKILAVKNNEIDENYKKEIKEIELKREEIKKHNEENNIITRDSQIEVELHNTKHSKLHLITFIDPLGDFIFSIIAPYGQTIKILNENNILYKEYAVRQNTTIVLDENNLIDNSKKLHKYDTEYRQKNETIFIKIKPITK